MIRSALLACALVALPSAALAQSQIATPPELRILRQPAAAPGDGPPADYIQGMAPEYNGWVYHDVPPDGSSATLYQGEGYPATIMVCPARQHARLLLPEMEGINVQAGSCATVTTERLGIGGRGRSSGQIRYRILAIHRATD